MPSNNRAAIKDMRNSTRDMKGYEIARAKC
jgi:hypothetical protein